MPGDSAHALVWSEEHQHYELRTRGQPPHPFRPGDEIPWHTWLDEHTAFAFAGRSGSLSALKESRARGTGYWYAYRTHQRRTHKRYLGPSARLTFERLEAAARALADESSAVRLAAGDAMHAAPWRPKDSTASAGETGRAGSRSTAPLQVEQDLALLTPKLSRPRPPTPLVERTRLLNALEAVRTHSVTLVSASAGSGKTTLLAAWAALAAQPAHTQEAQLSAVGGRVQRPLAWLSLDELDNEPTRFWTAAIAALRTCLPDCGQCAFTMLHSPEPPPLSTMVMTLVQDVADADADVVLILDDAHVLSDQAILTSMRFFIERTPSNLHLVLATRVDPDLPLARLRVRGRLLEIRDRDLRFTEPEAAAFLTQGMGLPLTKGEVATLHQRAEGWIAGLQLAALASRKHERLSTFVADFAGSHRFLLDYVRQEILAQLPEAVQDFMLQTAILPRMDAALCRAVTASPSLEASQEMLEALERANLFLVPLDEERRWYRLHDLFREALLAALHATQPATAPVLHRRAAAFYEAQGAWPEAITHELAAADYGEAARLMERTIEVFMLQGQAATMVQWVLALPAQQAHTYAHLILTAALYLLNTVTYATGEQRARMHATVRQLIARVETARAANQQAREDGQLQLRLRVLRLYLEFLDAAVRGEHERMRRMQPEMEAIQDALQRDDDAIWRLAGLSWRYVLHYIVRQEGAGLLPYLIAAKEWMSRSGNHFATIKAMQYVATAALEAGQPRVAYEESQAALTLIEQFAAYALLKGYFELVLIDVLYQWNRLQEARHWLHALLRDADTWQHLDLLGSGYHRLVLVELATGDGAAAQQALLALEDLVRREHFGTHPGVLPSMQAQFWLARGHVAKAATWASGVSFSEGTWDVTLYDAFPIVVRVYCAQRRWQVALELLRRWSGHLDRSANVRITITYLAQLLVALHHTGQSERAREVATRLFPLTEPEGYLRVFLDEGEPMRRALQGLLVPRSGRSKQDSSTGAYVSRLVAAFAQDESRAPLGKAGSSAPTRETAPHASGEAGALAPIEPLSPQEQRVLRLLVAGHTYAEMADRLVVSPNTIKTQVSSVYRKLGVSRRAEAIAMTARLHLA